MNLYPPSNRLLLALPPRNLKQLAPKLEFIRCESEQILLDLDASIDHVFFPYSGVISVVAVYSDGNVIEMATIGREGCAGVQPFLVPSARLPDFWYKFRVARRRCRAPRSIVR
jgi:CRP-like cAMP-binding protein